VKKKILYLSIILLLISSISALFLFTDVYIIFLKPLAVGEEIDRDYGDLILVPGGGLKRGNEIGFSTEERLKLAIDFFKQKKRVLVISDGSLYKGSPAIPKIVDFLTSKEVDAEYIAYEGRSQTTFDTFRFVKEPVANKNISGIIVCTSPYHQKRCELILNHLQIKNYKIAKMKESEIYRPRSIKQRLRNIKLILREYFAILKFKFF
jgi:uncharacterized SAM-binding protein YcdF (DUF218 family)